MAFKVGGAGRIDHSSLMLKVNHVLDGHSLVANAELYHAKVDELNQIKGWTLVATKKILVRGVDTKKLADDQYFDGPDFGAMTGIEEIGGERLMVLEPLKD